MIYSAFLFFTLMPYIGIGYLPSDVQPIAIILAAIIVSLELIKSNFKLSSIGLILFIPIILATVSILLYLFDVYQVELGFIKIVRVIAAYSTPFLIVSASLILLMRISFEKIKKTLDVILVITCFGFFINFLGLTEVIQLFVSRAIFDSDLSARGFTSFYPEPSRISEQMALYLCVYLSIGALTLKRLFLISVISLMSFSGQFFVMFSIVLLSFIFSLLFSVEWLRYKSSAWNMAKFFVPSVLSIILLVQFSDEVLSHLIELGIPVRGASAVLAIVNEGSRALSNDYGAIIKLSGVVYSLSTIASAPMNFQVSSIDSELFRFTISDTYFLIQNFIFGNGTPVWAANVYSALGNWIVDFGFIGFVLAVCVVGRLIGKSAGFRGAQSFQFALIVFIFCAVVKLPLANPTLWFLYAILLKWGSLKSERQT